MVISLELNASQTFALNFRIPNWTMKTMLKLNGKALEGDYKASSYFKITRDWDNQDAIELNFEMKPFILHDDPRVKVNRGRVAIQNGPLIYCLEQLDNKEFDILKSVIAKDPKLELRYDPKLLGGINVIQGILSNEKRFTAIPYYSWLNRGPNKMQVWNKIELN